MASLIPVLIPSILLLFLVAERVWPSRPLPRLRGWFWIGFAGFALSGILITFTSSAIAGLAAGHAPVDLRGLGVAGGLILAVAIDLLGYWWHRLRHRSTVAWRAFHQMHHAAERIDGMSAFFGHPLDFVSVGVVIGLASLVIGVTPDAAALATLIGFTLNVFEHANLRTPRWLGHLVSRPEMHAIHHERGVHAFNYAAFAFIDRAFGTWRNPDAFRGDTGFYPGAWKRVPDMLIGRDVVLSTRP